MIRLFTGCKNNTFQTYTIQIINILQRICKSKRRIFEHRKSHPNLLIRIKKLGVDLMKIGGNYEENRRRIRGILRGNHSPLFWEKAQKTHPQLISKGCFC